MQLQEKQKYMDEGSELISNYPEIIGDSRVLQQSLNLITKVASTDCTSL